VAVADIDLHTNLVLLLLLFHYLVSCSLLHLGLVGYTLSSWQCLVTAPVLVMMWLLWLWRLWGLRMVVVIVGGCGGCGDCGGCGGCGCSWLWLLLWCHTGSGDDVVVVFMGIVGGCGWLW